MRRPFDASVGTRRVKCCYGGEEQIPLCGQPTILDVCHNCLLLRDLIFFLSPVLFSSAQLPAAAVRLLVLRFSTFEMVSCVHMKAVVI